MSDLNAAFEAAVKNSTSISERPDNATLLKIYALYKQATEGDNEAKKPREKLKDTSADDAKQQYIDLIESLR
jgi:acyl-CoA-binding protein